MSNTYFSFYISYIVASMAMFISMGCSDQNEEELGVHEDKGYYSSTALWPSLDIPVCWENMQSVKESDRTLVRDAVNQTWAAAVPFQFFGWGQCETNSKGIRIKGEDSNPRAYIGTAIDGVKNGMFLNFSFNHFGRPCRRSEETRRDCVRIVAVHEFGHAIGIDHEQERDDTPDWCRDREGKYGFGGDTEVGAWDLDSVMNYCNPEWSGNGELSDGDIETVRRAYQSLLSESEFNSPTECLPLVTCQQACLGDISCQSQCFDRSPVNAQERLERLKDCNETLKCDGDWSCLNQYCQDEVIGCDSSLSTLGSEAVSIFNVNHENLLTCLPLLNCVDDCYSDRCIQDCYRSASGEAIQQYSDLTECSTGAGCYTSTCMQNECPEEVNACIN